MSQLYYLWIILSFTSSSVLGIPKRLLYDYGPELDTMLRKGHTSTSSEIQPLTVPIVFYGETYDSIYVNANGILSFLTDIPSFVNIQFPLDYPVIAPFYANVDIKNTSNVFFRETQNDVLLRRITESIHDAFLTGKHFTASSLFIATWNNVGYYNLGIDKVNTFQVVIANNATDSYVEFIYPEGGIQWIGGTTEDSRLPDARAQVGMVAGDGRYYTLRTSGMDQVQHIERSSNVGIQGVWMFHVGQINSHGNVMPPDLIKPDVQHADETCASRGYTTCHSKATCADYPAGFCCHCKNGFYGNGINCLTNDAPLRVSGRLSGRVNDVELEELDTQSYVITSDGRTYTAVSRVPESVGYDMQLLHVIGGVIGWLFARPINNAVNGYQLTGGVFNHTSTIKFTQTGESLVLRQNYLGTDVFNQLKMKAELQGTLPIIPHGSKAEISEYEERYTHVLPGKMFSRTNHYYTLEGVPVQHPFEMQHVVEYVECKTRPQNFTTLHMKITRNLVVYEAHDEIVRYGMTSKTLFPQDRDPCEEGRKSCVKHSSCVVDGDSYTCICHPGYQYILLENSTQGDAACVDVNECASGINNCHSNAECVNEEGTFSCHCKPGYNGDGRSCFAENCIVANNCSPFATCQYDTITSKYVCVCVPGYYGDGISCYETDTVNANCNQTDCWCPYDFELEGLICLKKKGIDFSQEISSESVQLCESECHQNAQCLYEKETDMYTCVCNLGYRGNGIYCERDVTSCNLVDTCEPGEECVYDELEKGYRCKCKENHRRNGTHCFPEKSCYDDSTMCGPDATCILSTKRHYICQCNEGFVGDGTTCTFVPHETEDEFLVTQGMAVLRISVSQQKSESRPIMIKLFQEAVGIDVDCLHGRVYWSDITGKVIRSAFYNGSDVNVFLNSDLGSLEGMSVDWISRNLYWTDSHKDTIEVANLDHKGRKVLISDDLTNPRGIIVHPELGKMFWSDWDRNGPKLESANLDGTGRRIFLEGSLLGLPNSLALDWNSNELCWADAGIHAIGCANINNSHPRIVVKGIKYPFGLAITPSSYFWTDWETQKVESAQKLNGLRNHAIITLSRAIGKLYGIVAVRRECPRLTNICAFENGLCGSDQLCLPKGSVERNCACANFNEEGSGNVFSCNEIV